MALGWDTVGVATSLTIDQTMDILRSTVPQLEALTHDVAPGTLTAVTDYGWSVAEQLGHLRACHDVLGGNMLRIVREDHPAWKGMSPRTWLLKTDYLTAPFDRAFAAFRAQRAELLAVLEASGADGWARTASVSVPPGKVYEYSTLHYGDWMARHERGHLGHMRRIIKGLTQGPTP
jgi:hypothetical protein